MIQRVIHYYYSGQKSCEEYFLKPFFYHRLDGPAFSEWFENGQKKCEIYFLDNRYHRTDGPAATYWTYDGSEKAEDYYLNGVRIYVKSLKDFKQYVKLLMFK